MKRRCVESIQTPIGNKTPRILTKENNSSTSSLGRDPVHVFCRLRPVEGDSSCIKLISSTTISLTSETKLVKKEWSYVFRQIFTPETSQREVFDRMALPLVEDVLNGKNGLLFTYGVTGSGKTFTISGDQVDPGIIPRSINTLFNTINDYQAQEYLIKPDKMNGFEVQSENEALESRLLAAKGSKRTIKKNEMYINDGTKIVNFSTDSRYSVFVTYVEIYNNIIYDLFDNPNIETLQSKIVREDYQRNMYVNGAVEVEIKSAAEAFQLIHLGQKRRRMAATILNAESSRSHSIFTIRVVQIEQIAHNSQGQPIVPDQNLLKIGQLSLVDLAGSERCKRTQNTGVRLKEAGNINNSLMSLRTCLEILRENQMTGGNKLVPYRDNRLTLLFKNYFEGDGQVRMIVCVNPSVLEFEENLQVLKFAEMTRDVKIAKAEIKYMPYRKLNKNVKNMAAAQTATTNKGSAFSFTPKIPTVNFNFESPSEDLSALDNLTKILYMRKRQMERSKLDFAEKEIQFRKRLELNNNSSSNNRSEMSNLKALLQKQNVAHTKLKSQCANLEMDNNNMAQLNDAHLKTIHSLENFVQEQSLTIKQNNLECHRAKVEIASEGIIKNLELEDQLQRQREHHEAKLLAKETKLRKVKEIVNNETQIVFPATSTPEKKDDYEPQQTPPFGSTFRRRNADKTNRQRRSRSAGEVWLEHNVITPLALGTVFQPFMKKRKSVTKLTKAQDITNPKQNRYCLVAQEPQADGELETKLYKGDILPTCGGGAQVVFNEVERLRQYSPTAGD